MTNSEIFEDILDDWVDETLLASEEDNKFIGGVLKLIIKYNLL